LYISLETININYSRSFTNRKTYTENKLIFHLRKFGGEILSYLAKFGLICPQAIEREKFKLRHHIWDSSIDMHLL
jgi:hypothetical protein